MAHGWIHHIDLEASQGTQAGRQAARLRLRQLHRHRQQQASSDRTPTHPPTTCNACPACRPQFTTTTLEDPRETDPLNLGNITSLRPTRASASAALGWPPPTGLGRHAAPVCPCTPVDTGTTYQPYFQAPACVCVFTCMRVHL